MKFPGRRGHKHYFPVNEKNRRPSEVEKNINDDYIVGLDQLLVDIEIEVSDDFLNFHKFSKGQSFLIDDELADKIYEEAKAKEAIRGEFPGGAIGNTLHNFAILSDAQCFALGSIKKEIRLNDYAFKYLSKTSGLVDMSYLQPSDRPMGRALCFITPDLERTFAVSKGCMNDLSEKSIPKDIIKNAKALLASAYTLRTETDPIFLATHRALEVASQNDVPVVLSLGTSELVSEKRDFIRSFCKKYVNVLAMNQEEAIAYCSIEDPLLALENILEDVDMAMITVGEQGLYIGAYCDEKNLRPTEGPLVTKSVVNYNQYEYSRSMRKSDCLKPKKIFTHVNPYQGGPKVIKNTNGAGDAALSALLHDICANSYHKKLIPNSPKHSERYLTYSSISQISKYANRVSYEVLIQNSPRLLSGLPEREATLDDAYWSS